MNTFGIIILSAVLLEFSISLVADALNLSRATGTVPDEFADVYPADRYRRSQAYLRVNTRMAWLRSGTELIVFFMLWFGKGFVYLDVWIRGFGYHWLVNGLLFIGALVLIRTLIMLPFNLVHTFVIEARFGFNRMTWKTFVLDRLKGAGLALALGGPLLAAVLYFFGALGDQAWWVCWLLLTGFALCVQYIAPTWIMPLFNKYTPLVAGELRDAIFAMARRIEFPLTNVMIMDGSRRSTKSNAFFTGFGKNKRIALFDTLVDQHNVPELVAVLAHEMGHYKLRHILRMMLLSIVQSGIMLYLLSLFLTDQRLFQAFYMSEPSVYAGLLFFAFLFAPLDFFIGLGSLVLSRRHEFEADRFSVRATDGDAQAMTRALKKLSAHNLGNLTPHPLYVFLNASHPPVRERIRAIETGEKS
jgi:STE24 endopeptidase